MSFVTDQVSEGAGAMQLEYSAHNIEAWGGYTKIYHMSSAESEPGEDTGIVFSSAFGGALVDGNTYTFPTGAEGWGGFANEDTTIYPFSFPNGGTISFTGETAGTVDSVDVYFRFEYNPYPDVEPSYNTAVVTVVGSEASSYSVEIPAQGAANTYSSFLFYVTTPDAPVTITNVTVLNNVTVTSGIVFLGAFGGTNVTGNTYTFPTGAQSWAGFANLDTDIYPFRFADGGTITFTGATAGNVDTVDVYFRFEYNPYPDTEPSFNTASVTVIGSADSSYSVLIPAQDAANTYSSFLLYVTTLDAPVTLTDIDVEMSRLSFGNGRLVFQVGNNCIPRNQHVEVQSNWVSTGGNVGVDSDESLIPKEFALYDNYPNPFNPTTKIAVDLPEAATTGITVWNIMGQRVATLYSGDLNAGHHTLNFNGRDYNGKQLTSGMYLYRVAAGKYNATKKMTLMK